MQRRDGQLRERFVFGSSHSSSLGVGFCVSWSSPNSSQTAPPASWGCFRSWWSGWREYRKEQMERRLEKGSEWVREWPTLAGTMETLDVVCDRGDGRPIDPDLVTKSFKKLAAKAGLDPKTTLHDLRHAVLTQLGPGECIP